MTLVHDTQFRKIFLVLLVAGLTLVLLWLLREFALTIVVAALLAGLTSPLYRRLAARMGGRARLAALLTVLLTLVVIIGPLLALGGLVVSQAASITREVRPVVSEAINSPTYLDEQLRLLPGYDRLEPYRDELLIRAGDIVNSTGRFLMNSLSDTTLSTVAFIFHFFIALYTMFFFLIDGPGMLTAVLDHLPLYSDEKELFKDRFLSITRATIKGTVVIGVIQGAMAGLAFAVAGISNATFWAVLMIVLSILPLIGSALIWVPACLILFASGAVTKAIVLGLFCALVVGSVDNVLRPWLVGRDTKMHDLVILFSTLGGILVIGPLGFMIGPVLAGLFVTSWQIFGIAYRAQLADGTPHVVISGDDERA